MNFHAPGRKFPCSWKKISMLLEENFHALGKKFPCRRKKIFCAQKKNFLCTEKKLPVHRKKTFMPQKISTYNNIFARDYRRKDIFQHQYFEICVKIAYYERFVSGGG
jgi:hypothetical protein